MLLLQGLRGLWARSGWPLRESKQKGFAVSCDLDGRALGGRTARRRDLDYPSVACWNSLRRADVGEFGMLGAKALGWEELGASLDGNSWGTSNQIFRLGLRTCVQGRLQPDPSPQSCSSLLCPPLCLPYGKQRKLQLRIAVGERCGFQLRLS